MRYGWRPSEFAPAYGRSTMTVAMTVNVAVIVTVTVAVTMIVTVLCGEMCCWVSLYKYRLITVTVTMIVLSDDCHHDPAPWS